MFFADELTAAVSNITSAKRLFEVLDCLTRVSGLKLNKETTEDLWLRSVKNCKKRPFGINWPAKPVKALVVYFSYDLKRFEEKLNNLKLKLKKKKTRDLAIYGRILLIKFDFLWKEKYAKVKRTVVMNSGREGG